MSRRVKVVISGLKPVVLGAIVGLCVGCTAEHGAQSSTMPTVRDSVGIRVLEYPGPLGGAAAALELVWEHGHAADDYPFQTVFTGAVRSDGSAVVVDGGNREVLAFDSAGQPSGPLAETGEGPGEVSRPRIVLVDGARTWVEDPGNTKIMRFVGDTLASTINTSVDMTLARSMMPLTVTAAGQLLMVTSSYRSRFEQEWLEGHVTRLDWESLTLDTIASYPMASRRPETGINPFGHGGFVAGFRHGLAHARTDVPEVVWRDAAGRIEQIARWRPKPAFPTEQLWVEFEEGLRAELRRVNPRRGPDRLESFLDERVAAYSLDPDEALPLFGPIVASREGDVWIPEYQTIRQRPSRYTILRRTGQAVAAIEFPRPVRVLDVNGSYALGVLEGRLGVNAVVVYRIGS